MKKLISTGLLILSHSIYADSIGTVLFTAKQVTAENSGATRALVRGGVLQVGDTIITAADASAKIKYANGTLVSIGPGSNYKIVSYSPNQSDVTLTAQLNQGKIESLTDGKEKREALKTPVVALAITGTRYKVYVPEYQKKDQISASSSATNIKNQVAQADTISSTSATDANTNMPVADTSTQTPAPDVSKAIPATDAAQAPTSVPAPTGKVAQTSYVQLIQGQIIAGDKVLQPGESIAATPAGIVEAAFPASGNVPAAVQIAAAPSATPASPSVTTSASRTTASSAGSSSSSSSSAKSSDSSSESSSSSSDSGGNTTDSSSSDSSSDGSTSGGSASAGGGADGAGAVSFVGTTTVAGQGVTSVTAASTGTAFPVGPGTFTVGCLGG